LEQAITVATATASSQKENPFYYRAKQELSSHAPSLYLIITILILKDNNDKYFFYNLKIFIYKLNILLIIKI